MPKSHTDREYEAELETLREQLLLMGAKVEEMLALGIRSLVQQDAELARRVIDLDQPVDSLEMEIDALCMRVLARRQPVASDLRFVTSALKLVTDLERIGDLAVNVGERVIELQQAPPLPEVAALPAMAEEVQGMVRDALDAFVRGDAQLARQVIGRDKAVDAHYNAVFSRLLSHMVEHPRDIFPATRLQSIAKYLERVGDHATNLAEMVVFMVSREDIRHRGGG
ncbi:MAG TPA: phosphate signaling complex protein PhoU [Myxococcales bacterium]|jgi:phosphate transport system protein